MHQIGIAHRNVLISLFQKFSIRIPRLREICNQIFVGNRWRFGIWLTSKVSPESSDHVAPFAKPQVTPWDTIRASWGTEDMP